MSDGRRAPQIHALEKRIAATVAALELPERQRPPRYDGAFVAQAALVLGTLAAAAILVPNRFLDPSFRHLSVALGLLGLWRFSWWFNHALRAVWFRRRRWPGMRARADALWQGGWRPRRLHIQMTTYREEPAITRRVLASIVSQVRREKVPTSLWVGTGSAGDEAVIRDYIATHAADLGADLLEVVLMRQNQPGKRMAIGMILRGMARQGVEPDDLVIFMDGDTIYGSDVLRKVLPVFAADPGLQALTTDEEVICHGPAWMGSWLRMRFAQRRLAMQSHALSDRVLTLTGRFSVFRARHIIDARFIRTIEADHLDHWLWGRFRFLSGDDKSTWYHLLARRARMTYVPDACVYTVEIVSGRGIQRMNENFRRWSGNMLRNGTRAIALGPRVVPPFIWWCLIDQRIAIWTVMVSPALALFGALRDPLYLASLMIWVVATRLVLVSVLYRHARRAEMAWTFLLYVNQIFNATVKIYMIFHLARQKWFNRGNQRAQAARIGWKDAVAKIQMLTSVAAFLTLLGIYAGALPVPF